MSVVGLNKAYRDFSLKNISFTLPQGCIMGFVGENGAGKTTTIKAVLGLIHRESGEISLLGTHGHHPFQHMREQIGVVFDESNFHDNLTVRDIDTVMRHIYRNWDDKLFLHYVRQFRLPENKTVKEFSRGMKMKLSMAAALAHHPKLLILDEATSGLDPIVREEMLDLFLEFIQQEDHSIFLSSHITSDLDKVADYITFIHQGEIVFSRSKVELVESMGIYKCGEDEFRRLGHNQALRSRTNRFGHEVLIQNKSEFLRTRPNAVVDRASIEDIMLFYVRGDQE